MTLYVDIGEVQIELQAANCNRLLAEGWVLLGSIPWRRLEKWYKGQLMGRRNRTHSGMGGASLVLSWERGVRSFHPIGLGQDCLKWQIPVQSPSIDHASYFPRMA
jgi:hypothetical protein